MFNLHSLEFFPFPNENLKKTRVAERASEQASRRRMRKTERQRTACSLFVYLASTQIISGKTSRLLCFCNAPSSSSFSSSSSPSVRSRNRNDDDRRNRSIADERWAYMKCTEQHHFSFALDNVHIIDSRDFLLFVFSHFFFSVSKPVTVEASRPNREKNKKERKIVSALGLAFWYV